MPTAVLVGGFLPSVFVRGLVDLYLVDRYSLAGTEYSVVGVAFLFPYAGMKTYGSLSNSRSVVRSIYSSSPVGNPTTHELANADCGNDPPVPLYYAPDGTCNMPCSGDPKQMCGGGNALSFWVE